MTDITFHRVAGAGELGDGEMRHVEIGERQIALFNLGGDFYATDELCTHAFAMLTDGFVDGELIECPLHGGKFEIKTGKAVAPPCTVDLKTYQVKVEGDAVLVGVPA
jgi:nitrite reductase/ring-hydroxylating ferredoxin subunit